MRPGALAVEALHARLCDGRRRGYETLGHMHVLRLFSEELRAEAWPAVPDATLPQARVYECGSCLHPRHRPGETLDACLAPGCRELGGMQLCEELDREVLGASCGAKRSCSKRAAASRPARCSSTRCATPFEAQQGACRVIQQAPTAEARQLRHEKSAAAGT